MKKKAFIFLITVPFLCFISLYFSNLLPGSLVTEALSSHSKIFQQVAPQGFGFYSKSPTEESISFESEHVQLPTAIPKNIFGLSRYGRAQAIELGKLYEEITDEYWGSCESEKECDQVLNEIKPYKVVKNSDMEHLSKGEYIINSQEPISWYFREYKDTTSFERKVAKVVIK